MANISNTISIKITADTKPAKSNIDTLTTKLRALKKVGNNCQIKIGISTKTVDSINKLSQINADKLDKVAKALMALSQVGKINGISEKTVTGIQNFVYALDRIRPGSVAKIERLANAMAKMNGVKISAASVRNAQSAGTKAANSTAQNAQKKASSLGSSDVGIGGIFGLSGESVSTLASSFGKAITFLEKYFGVLGKVASAIAKVSSAAFKGATAVERFVFALGKTVAKNIANKISEISKKINKAVMALSRVAVYRALRRAIQLVAQAFVTGTENLYAYSKAAGTDLSVNLDKLSSALMQMKNAIGTAVAPLINAFTPVILYLINAVTVLCDKIAQFVSLLSGVSKYSKAIGTSFGFEDAISGVGSAAGSASKELNKFTTSIDELNVISETSSSGGGSSYDAASAFTEGTASWWSDLAEVFNESRFVTFGQELAQKFNSMISSIDFGSLGTSLGGKIRNMAEIAFGFLSTADTKTLGENLAEFINNGIEAIPWGTIGTNFALLRNRFIDAFTGFFKGLNYENISTAIADFFNGAIKTIDLVSLADGIATAASGIVGSLADAITKMDLGTAFDELFEAGMKFIETMSESDVVSKVIGALNHIIDSIKPANVTEFINSLVKWFGDCWLEMRDGIKWQELCQKIGNALANVDWGEVLKLCFSIIKSVWDYIHIFTTDVWNPLCKSIASAFWSALKSKVNSMLGLDTDSDIGKYIVDGMRNAIKLWVTINTPFAALIEGMKLVREAWDDLCDYIEGSKTTIDIDYDTGTTHGGGGGTRTFASGGYPTPGDYFIANENGPELVGRIGSRTAVANQGQIVDAVSAGVYEAVSAALGSQKSSKNDINLSVYLDGKQIEASVRQTAQSRGAKIATGGLLNYSYT